MTPAVARLTPLTGSPVALRPRLAAVLPLSPRHWPFQGYLSAGAATPLGMHEGYIRPRLGSRPHAPWVSALGAGCRALSCAGVGAPPSHTPVDHPRDVHGGGHARTGAAANRGHDEHHLPPHLPGAAGRGVRQGEAQHRLQAAGAREPRSRSRSSACWRTSCPSPPRASTCSPRARAASTSAACSPGSWWACSRFTRTPTPNPPRGCPG
jgi:hypothetical protein